MRLHHAESLVVGLLRVLGRQVDERAFSLRVWEQGSPRGCRASPRATLRSSARSSKSTGTQNVPGDILLVNVHLLHQRGEELAAMKSGRSFAGGGVCASAVSSDGTGTASSGNSSQNISRRSIIFRCADETDSRPACHFQSDSRTHPASSPSAAAMRCFSWSCATVESMSRYRAARSYSCCTGGFFHSETQ